MTWSATAGKSPVQGDRVVTTVTFTNGVKSIDLDVANDGTQAGLEAACRAIIAARDAGGVRSVVAPGTVLDISDPVATPPTQAELDRAQWLKDWATYQGFLRGVAAKLPGMTDTAQQIVDAKTSLDARFKASYALGL